MEFTFQTTSGKLFCINDEPKNISDYWKKNKQTIRWCVAKNVADQIILKQDQVFFWSADSNGWQNLTSLDDEAKAVYRRLLKKSYTEAFENGVVLEHITCLNNQS